MIDMKPTALSATLLDKDKDLNANLAQQYNDLVGRLFNQDLQFNEGNTECPGKDEQDQELEEDIATMDTAPLELEEIPEIQEELPPSRQHPPLKLLRSFLCRRWALKTLLQPDVYPCVAGAQKIRTNIP